MRTWIAPNGRTYPVGPDHDLSLTADHDNPHPSAYRQPPLPGTATDEATGVIGDSGIQDSTEAGDTTQAMLDALIRKYGRKAA